MRMLHTTVAASLALALPASAAAQASAAIATGQAKPSALAPSEIVAAAPAEHWMAIAPADLLVMTLAPARDPGSVAGAGGKPRQIVIQLMPPPFSQGWVGNIRKLAAAHWWDGLSINRVQDNYVVQWGDPDGEDKAKAKALPKTLIKLPESAYVTPYAKGMFAAIARQGVFDPETGQRVAYGSPPSDEAGRSGEPTKFYDPYGVFVGFSGGFPMAMNDRMEFNQTQGRLGNMAGGARRVPDKVWPVHCYGMVGVGRDLSPDTGSGAELYTVIGHAPRHLDRNIALVGRVIEGIEHLSSLPRGTLALGFYEKPEQRVPIQSIRLATELPTAEQPKFEYLNTESASFARYADARANRRDRFFKVPAGGADICNIPVPVRRVAAR